MRDPAARNVSEILFEEYLRAHDLGPWEYEPKVAGKSARPDYKIPHADQTLHFDVKEFRQTIPLAGGGPYDAYKAIRTKINDARKKFKEYKEDCCCLVLHNIDAVLVDLDTPFVVRGAMMGDFGFSFPVPTQTGGAGWRLEARLPSARENGEREARSSCSNSFGWAVDYLNLKSLAKSSLSDVN